MKPSSHVIKVGRLILFHKSHNSPMCFKVIDKFNNIGLIPLLDSQQPIYQLECVLSEGLFAMTLWLFCEVVKGKVI